MARQKGKRADNDPILRELRLIKNLLMLQLLRQGMTSEQVDLAVKMGASEIRRMFSKSIIMKGRVAPQNISGFTSKK